MARRRWTWLVAAVVLLGAAAWLMSRSGPPRRPPPRVNLPRGMDGEAYQRLQRRRTLPPRFVVKSEDDPSPEKRPSVDPVMAAMPASVKRGAVVLEASAALNSPVGKLFADCMLASEGRDLERVKAESGLDMLHDVDRVAMIDDTALVTGRFADVKWDKMFPLATPTVLDGNTTLFAGEGRGEVTAIWNKQMMITGRDREAVMAVVDRLEGRTATEHPVLGESDSYGEIYGVVAPSALGDLLAKDQPALAERMRGVVDRITLHVDASHDVGIVADVLGKGSDTGDLGRAVGTALTVGRLTARANGDKDLAEVLDYARVSSAGGSSFRAELALTLDFFKDKLKDCAKRRGGPAANLDAGRPP